jgi:hypothetical protein
MVRAAWRNHLHLTHKLIVIKIDNKRVKRLLLYRWSSILIFFVFVNGCQVGAILDYIIISIEYGYAWSGISENL